jgi:hypothetical protein
MKHKRKTHRMRASMLVDDAAGRRRCSSTAPLLCAGLTRFLTRFLPSGVALPLPLAAFATPFGAAGSGIVPGPTDTRSYSTM